MDLRHRRGRRHQQAGEIQTQSSTDVIVTDDGDFEEFDDDERFPESTADTEAGVVS